jgi:cellulose synthase/poly-beta-1,6-N-acetylglucosamine synthase-like glycosyltransferase
MRFFEDKEVTAVTPSMKIYKPKGVLQRIQSIEYLIGIFLRKAFAELGSINVTPGPFSIYRMTFFKKHGKYVPAHNTEDIEMALRIQRHHGIIENSSDAFVYTVGPKTFKTLYKQRIRWYYGFLKNIADYKDLFGRKHGNLGMIVLPSSLFSILLLIAILSYQLINLVNAWFQKYLNFKAVNWNLTELQWFNFEPFFINTDATIILGLLSFLLAISIVYIAKEISDERGPLLISYIFFLIGYWILYAFWWLAAIIRVIRGKEVSWGHKSEDL